MSTQLRRIAQAPAHSPVRAKFFLALATITAGRDEGAAVATGALESVMTQTAFEAATGDGGITQYGIYRDMGREVVVTDADGVHLQKWRAVQRVLDIATEGVAADPNLYVLVWAADGANVNVARTG